MTDRIIPDSLHQQVVEAVLEIVNEAQCDPGRSGEYRTGYCDAFNEIRTALAAAPIAQPESWHEKADRLKKCVDYAPTGGDAYNARHKLAEHLKTEPIAQQVAPPKELSMSMFANRADYDEAVRVQQVAPAHPLQPLSDLTAQLLDDGDTRDAIRAALISVGHQITIDEVRFFRDPSKTTSALAQLCDSLEAVWPAISAETEVAPAQQEPQREGHRAVGFVDHGGTVYWYNPTNTPPPNETELFTHPAPQQEPQRAAGEEAEQVCAEAYQVVGSLLSDLGIFETPEAEKILDNLSQHRMVHHDVLPWPSFKQSDSVHLTSPVQSEASTARDAARLDWLDSDKCTRVFKIGKYWYTKSGYQHPHHKATSLRAAIDAALPKGKGSV